MITTTKAYTDDDGNTYLEQLNGGNDQRKKCSSPVVSFS